MRNHDEVDCVLGDMSYDRQLSWTSRMTMVRSIALNLLVLRPVRYVPVDDQQAFDIKSAASALHPPPPEGTQDVVNNLYH